MALETRLLNLNTFSRYSSQAVDPPSDPFSPSTGGAECVTCNAPLGNEKQQCSKPHSFLTITLYFYFLTTTFLQALDGAETAAPPSSATLAPTIGKIQEL